MLSYFRHISIISFVLVSVAAFFAGVYFRQHAIERILHEPLLQNSMGVAEYYEEKIWCSYAPAFKSLDGKAPAAWKKHTYYDRFDRASKLILQASSPLLGGVYHLADAPFFSINDFSLVVVDGASAHDDLYAQAKQQGKASRVLTSSGYNDTEGTFHSGVFVQVMIVLTCKNAAATAPNAVIELIYDKTQAAKNLQIFQYVVTFGIIITFILLYFALFYTSRRAEQIINKQHDENLSLADAKARAEMQNKEKSMFLANVSHELRTPLNAIIGFSEIIRDEVMGPLGNQQYKEYISDINTSGVHLLSLINDILDYSKAEARKLEVDFVDVDLTKVATSSMRLVEPRPKEAKVKLIENVPNKSVVVQADAKRMKQVVLNLLSNAVKFTPENGEIEITISEDILEEKVKIVVRDTGIGIAQKDISKALAPFGQVDSALSRRYEGTGLGLPLTKKLTEIMRGTFDLQSEEGLGTTVTLTFGMNSPQEMTPEKKKQF